MVSGIGSERTEDAWGDQERRDRDAMNRSRVRRKDGVRGCVMQFQDNDLGRSAGGAWSLSCRSAFGLLQVFFGLLLVWFGWVCFGSVWFGLV